MQTNKTISAAEIESWITNWLARNADLAFSEMQDDLVLEVVATLKLALARAAVRPA